MSDMICHPSKIQDRDLPLPGQCRKNILNKLQETVDLFELVISRTMDLSFFIHNSQIHQEWNRSSFLQYINLNRLFRLMLFHFDSYFTLFADKNTAIFASSLHLQLGKPPS